MEKNYEYRFELRPGKYVFIPTEESLAFGQELGKTISKRWQPADYFYHIGKRGGHVAALRPHLNQKYRASVDLRNFFGTVTRTKVQRSLRRIGFSNRRALDAATNSCVEHQGKKFLPYGFVQSMLLATLAFETSFVGSQIPLIKSSGVTLTMYVDDIIMSADSDGLLTGAFESLLSAIPASGFEVSRTKLSLPSGQVEAFNCLVEENDMHVSEHRMKLFEEQLKVASKFGRESILRYVGVIDPDQRKYLESI